MKTTVGTQRNKLILHRFNGVEMFPVALARWNQYLEDGVQLTVFRVDAGGPEQILEDTKELNPEPSLELVWRAEKGVISDLRPGDILKIPKTYDERYNENVSNFYYVEHDGTERNVISIKDRVADSLYAFVVGYACDVNYYDGSKPQARIEIYADFKRDADLMRSFS